jgi:hypothetical protein
VDQTGPLAARDVESKIYTERRYSVQTAPSVKNIFLYDSGEFVGSARVGSVKHKRLARGAIGPMRAGDILNATDLKRLKLDPSTVIYVT